MKLNEVIQLFAREYARNDYYHVNIRFYTLDFLIEQAYSKLCRRYSGQVCNDQARDVFASAYTRKMNEMKAPTTQN